MKYQIIAGIFLIIIELYPKVGKAQSDSIAQKLSFTGDFRFRIEPDWNSQSSDGSMRENRTRLRYRLRFGANYQYNQWVSFGMRIRTGLPNKQQDPQLTLGDGFKEFNTLPIGFEKVFIKVNHNGLDIWAGKNTFPFEKRNELFWSDNVYPEGVAIKWRPNFMKNIQINSGHFIVAANNGSLGSDSYFQGLQVVGEVMDRIKVFPSLYFFNDMPNIPDGSDTHSIDYFILHLGTSIKLLDKPRMLLELDYYNNRENYSRNDSIGSSFEDEKKGLVPSVSIGTLDEKNDLFFRFTWMRMERYAAVDFLAQNDWARWDYSAFDSPDGRLTNYTGFELMFGYVFSPGLVFNTRFFKVNQLKAFGPFKENGSRIRFDVDISF